MKGISDEQKIAALRDMKSITDEQEIVALRDKLQEARAERDQLANRNAELEQALAPFAEIMLNECNSPIHLLASDNSTVAVPLGVIRHAARAHAGTN